MISGDSAALSALSPGDRGKVASFNLPPEQKQRFLEMGLTIGTEVQFVKFAPMGDPLEIKVRGYHLSLRKADAAGIYVNRL